jgi:hypothetical protein
MEFNRRLAFFAGALGLSVITTVAQEPSNLSKEG